LGLLRVQKERNRAAGAYRTGRYHPLIDARPLRVLVVNAGSSSVKLRLIDESDQTVSSADLGPPGEDLGDHIRTFVDGIGAVDAVGHRVVHGGPRFRKAVVVDGAVRRDLDAVSELAPLHNPPALVGIDATLRLLPDVPSVACFDTAFHAGLPPAASTYAVPADWAARWGIRRYGFHGLSCAWATRQAVNMSGGRADETRLVICHLGAGASVTAVVDGHSRDTTMGFTPLEGLVMATRCGDLDPGALLWVIDQGVPSGEALHALEHDAGLLGLSGGASSDMRQVLSARADGDELAELAISVYLHRLRAKIAGMAAATGGTDVLVFTGGVGEHSAVIRAETCDGLGWVGFVIDTAANEAVGDLDADISAAGAPLRTLVIHAREDLQIASECRQVLGG
jgi:acetate kinase